MEINTSLFGANTGKKFQPDGTPRKFPGNTIISKIHPQHTAYPHLLSLRALLETEDAGQCFSWLPPSSYHMTVIEGVCDQVRDRDHWTSRLPLDAPLSGVDDLLEAAFRLLPPLEETCMDFSHIRLDTGITVRLRPATPLDEQRIRGYRDRVSEATGLRFPGHDDYEFHISLAYATREPTLQQLEAIRRFLLQADAYIQNEAVTFIVPPPELTFFDSMFSFETHRIPRDQ